MNNRRGLALCMLTALLWGAGERGWADTAKPMAFRHLTVANGLTQNTVMDIRQDSQGYIWIATENGLDRYDGHEVKSYQRGDIAQGELGSDHIWAIEEDAAQNLWLAIDGGGVARWDRRTDRFEHFSHDPTRNDSLSSDRARALVVTAEGIWIGTLGGGLNFLEPRTGRVTRYRHDPGDPSSLPSDRVYGLLQDDMGRLWVGTNDGLAWLQSGTSRFTRLRHDPAKATSLSHNRVRSLFQDRHGGIWVGTMGGGLNLLDVRTGRFKRFRHDPDDAGTISNDHVWEVLEDSVGRLWVATANGLNMLPPYSSRFWRYGSGERRTELNDAYVMSLLEDSHGILWVGTRFGGANLWNSDSWAFGHYEAPWLRRRGIAAFATEPNRIWVASLNGGIHGIDRSTGEAQPMRLDAPGLDERTQVVSLLRTRTGAFWIGTMAHGVLWRPSPDAPLVPLREGPANANGLTSDSIMSLYEDSAGNVWIGTFGGGVNRVAPDTGVVTQFAPAGAGAGFCGKQARAFAEDPQGNLWIGTEDGLCLFDRYKLEFRAFLRDGNVNESIYALHRDPQDRLWVGSGGSGLHRIVGNSTAPDSIRFETVSRRDGLASNLVYGILSDNVGSLWLSSNAGLSRFNPDTGAVSNFGQIHGLQGEEFHYGAAHKSADGQLFFGGSNGFNAFDPHQLTIDKPAPNVVLTEIAKLNQPYEPDSLLEAGRRLALGWRENAVTFEFAALDFSRPGDKRYEFLLEGFDEGWQNAGNRRSATYTNLPGGEYVLRARVFSADNAWNAQAQPVLLTVEPPPWQQVWAFVAYAVLLVGGVAALVRRLRQREAVRVEQRRRLESEVQRRTEALAASNEELRRVSRAKVEFLARMSHEVRTPMNGIVGMTELLARTSLTSRQKSYADNIQSSVDGLVRIVNDILDYSKLDSGKMSLDPVPTVLNTLLTEIVESFTYQAEAKQVALTLALPDTPPPAVMLDAQRLRQVLINLLSNALKFTQAGSVTLRLDAQARDGAQHLAFAVTDTGIGIAEDAQARIWESFAQEDASVSRRFGGTGLGLSICKELVELMGGELALVSAPGEGSTFSFEVTARAASPADVALREADLQAPEERLLSGRVLLVEDNVVNQQVFVSMLAELGVRCETASDGASGVMVASREDFDAVLMDYRLPDFDGVEATRRIRSLGGPRAEVPIVALTANAGPEERQHCLDAGMNDFLTKPCTLLQLAGALRVWLPEMATPLTPPDAQGQDEDLTRFDDAAIERIRPLRRPDGTAMLPHAIELFQGLSRETGTALDAALKDDDTETVRFAAHKLKSACANLGGANLASLYAQLESRAGNSPLTTLGPLLEEVAQEQARFETWLEGHADGSG